VERHGALRECEWGTQAPASALTLGALVAADVGWDEEARKTEPKTKLAADMGWDDESSKTSQELNSPWIWDGMRK